MLHPHAYTSTSIKVLVLSVLSNLLLHRTYRSDFIITQDSEVTLTKRYIQWVNTLSILVLFSQQINLDFTVHCLFFYNSVVFYGWEPFGPWNVHLLPSFQYWQVLILADNPLWRLTSVGLLWIIRHSSESLIWFCIRKY